MHLKSMVLLSACVLLALGLNASAQDQKVDPMGTWKWTVQGRQGGQGGQGGQPREVTLKVKKVEDKLAGTVTSGRNNTETEIKEITLKGDEIAFQIVREFGGNTMTQKYTGKIAGDTIKGKIESKRGDAEARITDWEAKREVAKPAAAAPAAN